MCCSGSISQACSKSCAMTQLQLHLFKAAHVPWSLQQNNSKVQTIIRRQVNSVQLPTIETNDFYSFLPVVCTSFLAGFLYSSPRVEAMSQSIHLTGSSSGRVHLDTSQARFQVSNSSLVRSSIRRSQSQLHPQSLAVHEFEPELSWNVHLQPLLWLEPVLKRTESEATRQPFLPNLAR